jgi:hypothetical protein
MVKARASSGASLLGPPPHSLRQVLQSDPLPTRDSRSRLANPFEELRVVLKPVLKPVFFRRETDQDASRPAMASDHDLL